MSRKNRIFIGFTDISGVGTSFQRGFQNLGYTADFYYFREDPFNYGGGKHLKFSKNLWVARFQTLFFIFTMLCKYDCFIYIISGTRLCKGAKEVKLFNFFKKKTMIFYVGCDARIPEKVEVHKWNPCTDCSDDYKKYVGCDIERKKKQISEDEKLFRYIFSPHECAGYIKRDYHDILWPINISNFPQAPSNPKNESIRILHAPTNEGYKGSKHIYQAIEVLKRRYKIDFIKVQGVTIQKLHEEISKSDLIIDQMLCGFYGLFSIESMAYFKPVACFIRPEFFKNDCPIINVTSSNIVEKLSSVLDKPNQLREIGMESRKFVEKYHSTTNVAKYILSVIK